MDESDVFDRVAGIAAMRHDPEAAHSEGDRLYLDLLTSIAAGVCSDPAKCSRLALALASQRIEFPRWCA